jgi:Domain of unknown function (DUF4287)
VTYKAYMQNIETKTGKTPEDLWKIANKMGFIKEGKIVATHAQLLGWLKSDVGLGHVHANMVIVYLRLRTNDPKVSEKMKNWAYSTGYRESE